MKTSRPMTIGERLSTMPIDELMELHRPQVPEGHVACGACDGTGTQTYGYAYGQPIEDRCSWCNGFGHKPAPSRISTLTTKTVAA